MNFTAAFAANTAATADLVKQRQDTRSAKESDVCISGTVESFVTTQGSGNAVKNVPSYTPPPTEKAKTRDGKKSYDKALALNVRVCGVRTIPGELESEPNAPPGVYRSHVKVTYISGDPKDASKIDTANWLRTNAPAIWSSDHPDSLRMREYVTADGTLTLNKWWRVSVGDMIKIKVPDQKDSVFRKMNPLNKAVPLVQPSTPVNFLAIARDLYVSVKKRPPPEVKEVEEPPVPEEGDLGMVLQASPTYSCKGGAVLSEDYDPNVTQSERMHEQSDPHKHYLVPYDQFKQDRNRMPQAAYFYVSRTTEQRVIGPLDPDDTQCVVNVRNTDLDIGDFISTFNGETTPNCRIRFHSYLYTARDVREAMRTGDSSCVMRNRYIIHISAGGSQREESILWRGYGILDMEHYGMIVMGNPEIPVHVEARLWESKSREHATNDPSLRNKGDGMENVQGYYFYFANKLVVDWLRYFCTMGVRVSPDWVRNEFDYWASTKKDGTTKYALLPFPQIVAKPNPVNMGGGLTNAVLSLGNGWHPDTTNPDESKRQVDPTPDLGTYHAFQGDIGPMLDNGSHDFFIVTSRGVANGGETFAKGRSGPYADEWINALKAGKDRIYYWIYAVRKDAKMARNYLAPGLSKPLPPTPTVNEHGKRERAEEDEEVYEEVEEEQIA